MNKTKTLTIGTMLAIVMIATVGSVFFNSNHAVAQEVLIQENVISVTGTATTTVEPDLLVITFGMENQEPTAKQALDSNSQAMNSVIEAIKDVGITEDEISTSRFNIYPIYDGYEDTLTKRWKQDLVGYQVTNTINVETANLNLSADIIDDAVTAGANRVDNVSFTLSSEKYMHLKDGLIEKAIQNAKIKAENALAPLDYAIVGVKAISLSEFGMFPTPLMPMPMFDMAFEESMAVRAASTPVFSSDQDVTTTANVIFLIGNN